MVAIKRILVGLNAVEVAILSGLNDRAAWRTNRVGYVTTIEKHTLQGEPIDMRRLVDFRPISADGLKGVIVRKNKEYIRSFLLLAFAALYQEKQATHYYTWKRGPDEEFKTDPDFRIKFFVLQIV